MSQARPLATPRRRPDSGGYARGAETRERIVAAALSVFAEEGYARASTRQIALAAGVTPPALQYHFDSKAGLHRACAESIACEVWKTLAPSRRAIEAAQSAEASLDALCDLLEATAGLFLVGRGADWGRFLGRAQADAAGPAAAVMREQVSRPLHALVTSAVARILDLDPEGESARLRASAIIGPLAAFHSARATTLAALDWPDYDGERLAAVQAMLAAHTRAALRPSSP